MAKKKKTDRERGKSYMNRGEVFNHRAGRFAGRYDKNNSAFTDEEIAEKPYLKYMERRNYLNPHHYQQAVERAKAHYQQELETKALAESGVKELLVEYYKLWQKNPEMAERYLSGNKELEYMLSRLPYNPILMYEPFETDGGMLKDGNKKSSPYLFHKDESPIRVVVTGNRCSKTYSGAADVISHCLGIDPITKDKIKGHTSQPYWVVSDTEDASKQIVQATYHDLVPEDYLTESSLYTVENGWRGNRITFRNGSQIEFRFSSQGRETFQGTYRNIHLDEEPPKDIYLECYARTTPVGGRPRGRMLITFTPIYNPKVGISWIQTDLYSRRHQIRGLSFHFWTLFDVPDYILPDEEKKEIISGYEDDEKDVRVFGLFTPVGMQLAFSRDLIAEQRQKATDPKPCIIETETRIVSKPVKEVKYAQEGAEIPTYTEEREVWVAREISDDSDTPEVNIFKFAEEGRRYAIGADPAEGLAHGDDSCAFVIDRKTYETVAEVQCKLDPDEFGELLNRLGRYYNNAYIGVENVADLTPIYALNRNNYPNLHYQCVIDGKPYDKQTDKIGWNTNTRTRRILRNDALELLRDGSASITSHALLDQMEIFARNPRGRWEAIAGGHDDMVFAWMIALQMVKCADIVDDWRTDGVLADDPNIQEVQDYISDQIISDSPQTFVSDERVVEDADQPTTRSARVIDKKLEELYYSEVNY